MKPLSHCFTCSYSSGAACPVSVMVLVVSPLGTDVVWVTPCRDRRVPFKKMVSLAPLNKSAGEQWDNESHFKIMNFVISII